MSEIILRILHQAFFGGIAAAGFGILFNCAPRAIPWCFTAGTVALGVRTGAQIYGLTLPVASFLAALALALTDRAWLKYQSPWGSVLAVVGAIPMVPGSLAAKVLIGVFALLRARPSEAVSTTADIFANFMIFSATLVAIGTALAIPTLIASAQKRG
jgi:uncharacterized membrane protein YjjB (DUF3815 family)